MYFEKFIFKPCCLHIHGSIGKAHLNLHCTIIQIRYHMVNVLKLRTLLSFCSSPGIHKMLVEIANREDPDQTASSEAA